MMSNNGSNVAFGNGLEDHPQNSFNNDQGVFFSEPYLNNNNSALMNGINDVQINNLMQQNGYSVSFGNSPLVTMMNNMANGYAPQVGPAQRFNNQVPTPNSPSRLLNNDRQNISHR